jgi:tetratricopeptide (TPR) repeat protein
MFKWIRHLWSETFDKELEDIFAIQSEIAQKIATALRLQLLARERQHVKKKATENSNAYTYYPKGRYFWNKRTYEWFNKAIELFELAIKEDPNYALAFSGLADCHVMMGRRGDVPPIVACPKAKEFAYRALELDESLAEPHATLWTILAEYEWRWQDGEEEFRRAIELNPSYAIAHNWYALYLGHVGRFDEAIAEANLAIELDPLSPVEYQGASEEYVFAGQNDKAIEAAHKALEIDPDRSSGHAALAFPLMEKGMYDEAIVEHLEALRFSGDKRM